MVYEPHHLLPHHRPQHHPAQWLAMVQRQIKHHTKIEKKIIKVD